MFPKPTKTEKLKEKAGKGCNKSGEQFQQKAALIFLPKKKQRKLSILSLTSTEFNFHNFKSPIQEFLS